MAEPFNVFVYELVRGGFAVVEFNAHKNDKLGTLIGPVSLLIISMRWRVT